LNSQPNNSPENDWELQLAEYSMGIMEPAQAAEFERGLNECIAHVALARQYTEVVGMLGQTANAAEPPEGHKSRFISRLSSTHQATGEAAIPSAPPVEAATAAEAVPAQAPAPIASLPEYRERRRSIAVPLIATLAAALVILLGGWAFYLQNELITTRATHWFPVQAQAPYTSTVALVSINTQSNEASLQVTGGLQTLPQDKVYELWWIPAQKGAAPVPAGVFNADASGKALHSAKAPSPVSTYAAVAVTIENAPEKPAPEGPIIMVGAYSLP